MKCAMIQVEHPTLSVRRQCELVGLARATFYYEPVSVSDEELMLLRTIDELHLEYPFFGSRKLVHMLRNQGIFLNRKHVQRLMQILDLRALVPQPKTTEMCPEHVKYPYLLRNLKLCRVNQVWAADITYIPLAKGFVYLVAILDIYTRHVLAWRVSNTMETQFCLDALEEALTRFGKPEIFNTDQGAQFTDARFTGMLLGAGIRVSMDGKGRWVDNVFVERLWRTLKYEEVYLYAYEGLLEARERIGIYLNFYCETRPHASLGYATPAAFHAHCLSLAA